MEYIVPLRNLTATVMLGMFLMEEMKGGLGMISGTQMNISIGKMVAMLKLLVPFHILEKFRMLLMIILLLQQVNQDGSFLNGETKFLPGICGMIVLTLQAT
jgi:hypothetical protein